MTGEDCPGTKLSSSPPSSALTHPCSQPVAKNLPFDLFMRNALCGSATSRNKKESGNVNAQIKWPLRQRVLLRPRPWNDRKESILCPATAPGSAHGTGPKMTEGLRGCLTEEASMQRTIDITSGNKRCSPQDGCGCATQANHAKQRLCLPWLQMLLCPVSQALVEALVHKRPTMPSEIH